MINAKTPVIRTVLESDLPEHMKHEVVLTFAELDDMRGLNDVLGRTVEIFESVLDEEDPALLEMIQEKL